MQNKKDKSDYISKDNSELKNFNFSNIKIYNPINFNEDKIKNEDKNNFGFNLDTSPICNKKELFLSNIGFLSNYVFSNFYEQNSNKRNSKNYKNYNCKKYTLS
jgi:hypothetical protein